MPRLPLSADALAARDRLRALVDAPVATADDLMRILTRIYADLSDNALRAFTAPAAPSAAPEIMSDLFLMRARLRDRIGDWQAQGFMTRDVQHALRDALRLLRYASDMAGEAHAGFVFADDALPARRAFKEYSFNTFVHPAFDDGRNLDFQSGDVLLVRGTRHNSAAIARIGDVDSQFSHAAIIHFDQRGRGWVIESLIEEGAVISPLIEALEHRLARAVLLRPKDRDLGPRASQLIFDLVRRSQAEGGEPILYDFSMQPQGRKRMYCTKLVAVAYEDASEGRLKLPAFGTRFNAVNRSFYRRIGVRAVQSFAPGDLEIEPAFDLVAEWHDDRYTSQVRLQDLIMTQLFAWMDAHGYRFREDGPVRLISWLGQFSTRLSRPAQALVSSLFPRIPPHMPRRTIATIVMLHKTAQPLLEDLQHLERLTTSTERRPLRPAEIFAHLEAVRQRQPEQLGYLVLPRPGRRGSGKYGGAAAPTSGVARS